MKKVYQTKFGESDGNCFNACLASILEIDIESIPNPKSEFWQDEMNEWLIKNFGLYLLTINSGGYLPKCFNESIVIAVGNSTRGLFHAVLYQDGKMLHDPHPDGNGIEKIESYDLLVQYF